MVNSFAYTDSISIHALLAESDAGLRFFFLMYHYFYPRSPCGERLDKVPNQGKINQFLSTLSLRRATKVPLAESTAESISIHALLAESDADCPSMTVLHCISIHALLAESDNVCPHIRLSCAISIHALLAESDHKPNKHQNQPRRFLSTLSLRRAT